VTPDKTSRKGEEIRTSIFKGDPTKKRRKQQRSEQSPSRVQTGSTQKIGRGEEVRISPSKGAPEKKTALKGKEIRTSPSKVHSTAVRGEEIKSLSRGEFTQKR
jgi:hypothetical protein